MSIATVDTTNHFAIAKEEARQRAEIARKREEEAAKQLRLQKEAAQQLRLQEETTRQAIEAEEAAKRTAAAAAQREMVARAARKQGYLDTDVKKFKERFLFAVAKRGSDHYWKEAAFDLAEAYAKALVSHDDVELPKIDPTMAADIHGAFAYGMYLYVRDAKPVNIPADYFLGQRQDWFPALLAEKTPKQKTSKKAR
jgi:hypothetical protein